MPSNESRDRAIVESYLDGTSVQDVARDFSLSYPTVLSILKRLEVWNHPDRKEAKKSRAYARRDELSKAHRILGVRLYTARNAMSYDLPHLCTLTGVSVKKLNAIEQGISDLTFMELLNIGHVLNLDLTELVKGIECLSKI